MTTKLGQARRVVVKLGSSLVTNDGRGLDTAAVQNWCSQFAKLAAEGREVIVVSSGAIAEGVKRLGWQTRPQQLHELQAAAAVGQMGLAQVYETSLREHGLHAAQILLTHADLADRERYLNARSTLLTLLSLRVIPVINENDTVVNEEIKFGDNDTLAALVSNLVEADLLVILTDQRGLYSADPRKNPHAQFIHSAVAGDPALEGMAGGAGSALGRGGMITKILAAKRAARSGASTVIAWGREDSVLIRLCEGEEIGTLLQSTMPKIAARKQWMINQLQFRGTICVDEGAALKVALENKSLLPVGILEIRGDFHRGDVVSVIDFQGKEIARGLSNYASAEARIIRGHASSMFESLLGFSGESEMIHRDNMILI
jgi:glutamate 5-kinase